MAIRIPVITSEPLGVPSVQRGRTGSALGAQLGAAESVQGFIGQVMQDVNEFRQKTKASDDNRFALQTLIDTQEEYTKEIDKLRTNANPDTYFEDSRKIFLNIAKNKLGQIKDPYRRNKTTQLLMHEESKQLIDQSHYGNLLRIDAGRASTEKIADVFLKRGEPEKAEAIYRQSISDGFFKKEEAETAIKNIWERNSEAKVRSRGLIDPEGEIENLGDKNYEPHLDPVRRQALIEHFEVRIRGLGTRFDRLTKAIQKQNQADAIDEYDAGTLTLDGLRKYRQRDIETGEPGLSDEFFMGYRDKLLSGKDVPTDPIVYRNLYFDENLTREKVDVKLPFLNSKDSDRLYAMARGEQQEKERDIKYWRRHYQLQDETERRAAKREDERTIKEEARQAEKEEAARIKGLNKERDIYYRLGREKLKSGFKELEIKMDQQLKVINEYEAFRIDENVKSEDLVTKAVELIKSVSDQPGLWDRVFNPEKVKSWKERWGTEESEKPKVRELTPDEITAGAIPGVEEQPKRKPLDDIFGTKK